MTSKTINEDSSFSYMARVHADGVNILQANLSAITYAIYNQASKAVILASTALTISNVIFDTLQTDGRWDEDGTGYNFRHDLDQTALADPSIIYVIEYRFTLQGGNSFYLDPATISVREILSS